MVDAAFLPALEPLALAIVWGVYGVCALFVARTPGIRRRSDGFPAVAALDGGSALPGRPLLRWMRWTFLVWGMLLAAAVTYSFLRFEDTNLQAVISASEAVPGGAFVSLFPASFANHWRVLLACLGPVVPALCLGWAARNGCGVAGAGRGASEPEGAKGPYSAAVLQGVLGCCWSMVVATAYLALVFRPSPIGPDEVIQWGPVLDKRWISMGFFALGGLSLTPGVSRAAARLLLLPGRGTAWGFREKREILRATARASSARSAPWTGMPAVAQVACALVFAAGYAFPSLAAIGPGYEFHLGVQLTALQGLLSGNTPFVQAETQYGIGFQSVMHWFLSAFGPDYRNAQLFCVVYNGLFSFVFAMAMYRALPLSFLKSTVLVILSLAYMRHGMSSNPVGWWLLPRWLGVFVVAMTVPKVFDDGKAGFPFRLALLGAFSGTLAWLHSENLMAPLVCVGLILLCMFSLGVLSLRRALTGLAGYTAVHLSVFLVLTGLVVGWENTGRAIGLLTRSSDLVYYGISNIYWEHGGFFRLAYWLAPFMAAGSLLTITIARKAMAQGRVCPSLLEMYYSLASAVLVVSVVATMQRTGIGRYHCLVSGIAPFLYFFTLVPPLLFLPRLGAKTRGLVSACLFLVSCFGFYVLPFPTLAGLSERFIEPFPGSLSTARETALAALGNVGAKCDASRSVVECRLGFGLSPGMKSLPWAIDTEADLRAFLRDIDLLKCAVGAQPVVADVESLYFFADLHPGTPAPSATMSLWVTKDIPRIMEGMKRLGPRFLVTDDVSASHNAAMFRAAAGEPKPVVRLPFLKLTVYTR